jgi:hypothetical protein
MRWVPRKTNSAHLPNPGMGDSSGCGVADEGCVLDIDTVDALIQVETRMQKNHAN